MSPFEIGMVVGAFLGAAIGFCACAICVAAGRSDERMTAPQTPEDLLDADPDHFDKRV